MSAVEVKFICDVLAEAVDLILDPATSPQRRAEAQQFCDEFRDMAGLRVPCSLRLTEETHSTPVRYYALKVLEHHVRVGMVDVSTREGMLFKDSLMGLMLNGTKHILEEEACIKEALVRVMVQLIKCNWPHRWQSLLVDLRHLCQKGASRCELAMLTLLRLAENEGTQKGVKARGFEHDLQRHVRDILEVVHDLIKDSVQGHQFLKTRKTPTLQIQVHCRMIIAAINTMAQYIKLAPLGVITANNVQLLDPLWCLLNDSDLQLEAAECLLVAVTRIAKIPHSKPLLVLFKDVAMQYIFPEPATGEVLTERCYSFLKKKCQILCIFGEQLCRTINFHDFEDVTFGKYLDSLLYFTVHSSQYLSYLTQSTWKTLFSHKPLSQNQLLLTVLPRYLLATRTNLMMVCFPSKNCSRSCEYSHFDFLTDDDFHVFLKSFREEQRQVISVTCRLAPNTCFRMASEFLKRQLLSPVDSVRIHSLTQDGFYCTSTNSFHQWEAVTFLINIIVKNLSKHLQKQNLPVNDGIELLQLLLNFKTKDPLILACVPLNICTLLPFLNFKNELVPQVLNKLLEVIEEIKAPKSQALKSGRRDACSCVHRICRDKAQFLLPNFLMLFNNIKQLLCNELLQLTLMEKSTLIESMVILINHLKDYPRQKVFLEELMAPVSSLWLSNEMQKVFADPDALVHHVCADLQTTKRVVESDIDLNSSEIIHCVATILGVLKWTCCPADVETAKTGGFVIEVMFNGKPTCRNPCTEQVLKLLDNLFVLIKTQNMLYLPEVMSKMGKKFAKVLGLPGVKNTSNLDLPRPLLDIYDPPEYKTTLESKQGFFCTLYTFCFGILGYGASSLKRDFYSINSLVARLLESAFANLENIPNSRLLSMVRNFLKPLVDSCPPEYYETFLSPIMRSFLPFLHTRLTHDWNIIEQQNARKKKKTAFGSPKLTKSLRKQVKLLTEEAMELIICCCVPCEDENIVIVSNSNVTDLQTKRPVTKDGCSMDADTTVVTIESDDVCIVSSEEEDDTVCVAESDDDDCASVGDAHIGVLAAVNDDACCVSNEKTDAITIQSNVAEKSAEGCSLPSVSVVSSAESTNMVCPLFDKNADIRVRALEADEGEGEVAAEAPSLLQPSSSKHTELTTLGLCLMKDEDIRSAILATSFSSLVWKHLISYKVVLHLCWPLLKHIILEPLHADTVTYFFTMVLKGLEVHKVDRFKGCAFDELAFKMYRSLRSGYSDLNKVMQQVPSINLQNLDKFDKWILDPTVQKPDHVLLHDFKGLIKGCTLKQLGKHNQNKDHKNIPLHHSSKLRKRLLAYTKSKSGKPPLSNQKNRRPLS